MIRKSITIAVVLVMVFCANSFSEIPGAMMLLHSSPSLRDIHTPKDLSKFMNKNFKFVEDRDNFNNVEYWQSPEEMLKNKRGDCEDFAIFTQAILKELGIESQVVSIYGKNRFAHTVAVFKQDGKYRVFNDGRLYRYDTDKIEEVLTKISETWIWAAYTERKNNRGWMNGIFYNPAFQPQSKI